MIHWFYCLPWCCLFLIMPGIAVLYGCVSRLNCLVQRPAQIAAVIICVLWIAFTLWMTLVNREDGDYDVFQPLFQNYREAVDTPERYRSNFMNVLLFFPAGLFLFHILPCGKKQIRFFVAVAAMFLLSTAIECTQFVFSIGLAEMDDILHNTIGAAFGAGAAWFAPRIITTLIAKYHTRRK